MPHLAALTILLAGRATEPGCRDSPVQMTFPADAAGLIDQLRADGIVLTYHPDNRTLRAGDRDAPSVTIGKDTTDTHSRQNKVRRSA